MKTRRRAATLVRLALVEVGAYPVVVPGGAWEERLRTQARKLSAEDGWALAHAAELLAAYPDRGFWEKVTTKSERPSTG